MADGLDDYFKGLQGTHTGSYSNHVGLTAYEKNNNNTTTSNTSSPQTGNDSDWGGAILVFFGVFFLFGAISKLIEFTHYLFITYWLHALWTVIILTIITLILRRIYQNNKSYWNNFLSKLKSILKKTLTVIGVTLGVTLAVSLSTLLLQQIF